MVPTRQDRAPVLPEANVRPDHDQRIELLLSKSTFHEDRDTLLKVQQRSSEQRWSSVRVHMIYRTRL